ncbi:MAG: hypothetical protein NTY19_13625 [Planctomycetota bacterium]|nr:hypothetical protein [Planctomycetota bacterium]
MRALAKKLQRIVVDDLPDQRLRVAAATHDGHELRDGQRLVLLFNETDAAQSVVLTNKELAPGQTATVFGTSSRTSPPKWR